MEFPFHYTGISKLFLVFFRPSCYAWLTSLSVSILYDLFNVIFFELTSVNLSLYGIISIGRY